MLTLILLGKKRSVLVLSYELRKSSQRQPIVQSVVKFPEICFVSLTKKKKNQNKLVDLGGVKVPLKLDILDLI